MPRIICTTEPIPPVIRAIRLTYLRQRALGAHRFYLRYGYTWSSFLLRLVRKRALQSMGNTVEHFVPRWISNVIDRAAEIAEADADMFDSDSSGDWD